MNRLTHSLCLAAALFTAISARLTAQDLTPPTVAQPLTDVTIAAGTASTSIPLGEVFALENVAPSSTFVRFKTELGKIDVELLQEAAPKTVANFLHYATLPAYQPTKKDQPCGYTRSIIHRSVPGSYFQGGGYVATQPILAVIPQDAPVEHEASISNTRGTLAAARAFEDEPGSATCEWFFNTADNSTAFDGAEDGYAVFGRVITDGLTAMDAIAAVPVPTPGPWPTPFEKIPLQGHQPGDKNVHPGELVVVKSIAPIALTPAKVGDAAILKLGVKTSKPALVAAVIKGSALSLRFTKGKTGSATITVTARDTAGSVASTAFVVTVQ